MRSSAARDDVLDDAVADAHRIPLAIVDAPADRGDEVAGRVADDLVDRVPALRRAGEP